MKSNIKEMVMRFFNICDRRELENYLKENASWLVPSDGIYDENFFYVNADAIFDLFFADLDKYDAKEVVDVFLSMNEFDLRDKYEIVPFVLRGDNLLYCR